MAKKQFALRIDEELLAAIEKWAGDEFRSANGQIEWMLNKALRESGRLKKSQPPGEVAPPANEETRLPPE